MVKIYFQEGDGISRPDDASLTLEPLPLVNTLAEVPLVGDYIEFDADTGDGGIFKVISRLLQYKTIGNKISISAYVVLEKQSKDIYGKLAHD